MFVPLDFSGPEHFVWDTDLMDLPLPTQAAWAAFCVGTLGPIVLPGYHDLCSFGQCIRTAWDFALGRPFDHDEARRLDAHLAMMSEVFGDEKTSSDNPGRWLSRQGYDLSHVSAPGYLLMMALGEELPANLAMNAVENAGLVYKHYQFSRQGFWDVTTPMLAYVEYVADVFYAMTRRALAVARAHDGPPTETMFAAVEFPWECEPLAPELAAECRRLNPINADTEKWLRQTGRWLGSA